MCAKPGGTLAPQTEHDSIFGVDMNAVGCWQRPTAKGFNKLSADPPHTTTSNKEAGVIVSKGTSEDTESEIATAGTGVATADLAS